MLRFDLVVVAEENTAQRRREQARLLISFQVEQARLLISFQVDRILISLQVEQARLLISFQVEQSRLFISLGRGRPGCSSLSR